MRAPKRLGTLGDSLGTFRGGLGSLRGGLGVGEDGQSWMGTPGDNLGTTWGHLGVFGDSRAGAVTVVGGVIEDDGRGVKGHRVSPRRRVGQQPGWGRGRVTMGTTEAAGTPPGDTGGQRGERGVGWGGGMG